MSDRPEPFSSHQSALNNLQVGGSLSTGDITQNINQAKPEFYEPKLEQFKPPNFISPKVTPNLIKLLLDQNLLVLGESPDIDKTGLARHLAWCLSEELQQQPTSTAQKIPIKEWCRSSDRPSLDVELQETEATTIFILPQILPLHIEQDFSQLQRTASSNGHYIIASTNISRTSWKLSDSENKFWQGLLAEGLYHTGDLAKVLIDQLKEVKKPLPPDLLDENVETDLQLANPTLQEVVQRLKTPERIARFVELLRAEEASLSKEAIGKLIELAQNNKEVLRQWFHKILKPHEQLLALGLNFFDGLFDDQCMAGVGELVEHEWHRREPFLRALDYCDLDNLHNFFRLVEIQAEKTRKFESSLPEQRRMLFEVAWDSYRLRLQTALPVMVELVEKSVSPKSYERTVYGIPVGQNLYSTDLRRKQLRSVIAEAISDIGLIESREVQETLLQLAAHSNPGVQAVAAQAMERWREYGRDRELFDTLKILLNSERRGEKKGENPKDNILSTIALTIGYAAKYDTPQKLPESSGLSEELCNFLKQLSENPSPSVRRSFGLWTLRMVVPLHVVQLRDILRDMTRYTDLIPYISESLREAYLKNPEEVLTTLNLWYAECLQPLPQLPQSIEQEKIPLRQTLLATVALTYVRIQCTKGINSVTDSEAFRYLHLVFTEDTHPLVRKTVIDDLCIQTDRYFQRLEPHLRNLVANFTEDERDRIIEALTKVYQKQREKLQGGGTEMAVDGVPFPAWINPVRQSTALEDAMFHWLRSEDNAAAQMIGAILVLGEPLNPKEILKTLESWYQRCVQTRPPEYEIWLAAIALISIQVQCDEKVNQNSAKGAFKRLQTIILGERHPFVEKAIINALINLSERCFQRIKPKLKNLVADSTDNQRYQIVEILIQVYQRREGLERSHTGMEQVMLSWLNAGEDTRANYSKAKRSVNFTPTPENQEESPDNKVPRQTKGLGQEIKEGISDVKIVLVVLLGFLSFYISFLIAYLMATEVQKPPASTQPPLSNSRLEHTPNSPMASSD